MARRVRRMVLSPVTKSTKPNTSGTAAASHHFRGVPRNIPFSPSRGRRSSLLLLLAEKRTGDSEELREPVLQPTGAGWPAPLVGYSGAELCRFPYKGQALGRRRGGELLGALAAAFCVRASTHWLVRDQIRRTRRRMKSNTSAPIAVTMKPPTFQSKFVWRPASRLNRNPPRNCTGHPCIRTSAPPDQQVRRRGLSGKVASGGGCHSHENVRTSSPIRCTPPCARATNL